MNLTKTIRKAPIDLDFQIAGHAEDDHGSSHKPGPKYDAEDTWVRAKGGGARGYPAPCAEDHAAGARLWGTPSPEETGGPAAPQAVPPHPPNPLNPAALSPQYEHIDITKPIDHLNFVTTLNHYPIVVVNFYAPWWVARDSHE
jgi:hypothetical protein